MNISCLNNPKVICNSKPLHRIQKRNYIRAMQSNVNKELKFVNDHCDTNDFDTECVTSWERISLQTKYIYELIKKCDEDIP